LSSARKRINIIRGLQPGERQQIGDIFKYSAEEFEQK